MTQNQREHAEQTALELIKQLSDSQLAVLVQTFMAAQKTEQTQE